MIILNNLGAKAAAGEYPQTRGVVAALHHELAPGCLVRIELDPAGLRILNGEIAVGFPLEELIRLAQFAEPRLKPPGS